MRTTIDAVGVEYKARGSGVPLVLVHGYPLNRTMWEPQLEGLSQVARVIAPDLPGFGGTEPRPMPSIASYADFIHSLLERIGVPEPIVICGLSMGGYVALAYHLRYAAQLRGLILANTRAGPDSAEGKVGRDRSAALAQQQGAAAIAEAMLPKLLAPRTYAANPDLVARVRAMMETATVPGIVDALRAMKERPDSTPVLGEIRIPALIVGGAEDQLIPPGESEALARALVNARLEMLPGAGHLSNMEQPDLYNRAVAEYLGTIS